MFPGTKRQNVLRTGRALRQTAVCGQRMKEPGFRYIYGPVPSRRLGRSLGLDLVPFKTCTYDCVYCQLGRTTNKTVERKEYVPVKEILAELEKKLAVEDTPDYISLAGSGEPTLNAGIGDLIGKIQGLTDIPVAVLTNGSLLWMSEVQDALMAADLVLPSLDAGDEHLFRYVNRPHGDISFERMVNGIAAFTKRFPGEVWLEVLLLAGVTGIPSEVKKIATLAERIGPARVQLNTVSRPPAEEFALPLSTDQMLALKDIFPRKVDIISQSERGGARVSAFSEARDADILALLKRRSCTSADVASGLGIHVNEALKRLEALITGGKVKTVFAAGRAFYTATALEVASMTSEEKAEE
jgi:wyosine [tRNA(Phe)-imidazoG37] synthetase (radical SAM superfamily)